VGLHYTYNLFVSGLKFIKFLAANMAGDVVTS